MDGVVLFQLSLSTTMTSELLTERKRRAVASFAIGVILGVAFLFLGVSHNAQLEFQRVDGGFDIIYATVVFAAWLVLGSILSYIVLTGIAVMLKKLRRGHRDGA